MASAPRWGREPWAATPVTVTSVQTNPRWAVPTCRSVGSVTTAASMLAGSRWVSTSWMPEAGVLLVGDGGDDDLAVDAGAGGVAAGDEGGGEAGLHVVGAAGVEPVALDAGHRAASCGAGQADGVEVAAQQQPAARRCCGRRAG